jgi:Ca2+/Na+ antiporter
MNRAQETSLALMIMMPLGALIPGSVAVLLVYTQGVHPIPVFMFTLAIVLGSLFWLAPAAVQKIHKSKKVVSDERDVLICKNGAVAAHIVLWLYFAIACLVAWWLVGPEGTVSVNVMPLVLIGAVTLYLLVEYLAAFIQYGRGGNENQIGTPER